MPKTVRHAIIPCAGLGTRMLPLSKSIPKELLPLGDLPAIDYVAHEAMRHGLQVVLVSHAKKSAIDNYFDDDFELTHKVGMHRVRNQVVSVRQGIAQGLGHAIWCARMVVDGAPFCVLLPDVVLSPFDGAQNSLAQMLDDFAYSGRSQILVEQVLHEDIDKYGIVGAPLLDGHGAINKIVEKPQPHNAPSNLAVVGRYVLHANTMCTLDNMVRTHTGSGEIGLTEALNAQIGNMDARLLVGKSFDVGNMPSYLRASRDFAAHWLDKHAKSKQS